METNLYINERFIQSFIDCGLLEVSIWRIRLFEVFEGKE